MCGDWLSLDGSDAPRCVMTASILALACLLDALLGDPRWFPHPVRVMGKAIVWIDVHRRSWLYGPRRELAGGIVLALALPALAFGATWAVIALAGFINVFLGVATSILLGWTTLGGRDLVDHVLPVLQGLHAVVADLNENELASAGLSA